MTAHTIERKPHICPFSAEQVYEKWLETSWTFIELAEYFGCSEHVIANRLHEAVPNRDVYKTSRMTAEQYLEYRERNFGEVPINKILKVKAEIIIKDRELMKPSVKQRSPKPTRQKHPYFQAF